MAERTMQAHTHKGMVHSHEHIHVTHHARHGDGGQMEHLVSRHMHEHDHAALGHAHGPHEDPEREHSHEAHIHDHLQPVHH